MTSRNLRTCPATGCCPKLILSHLVLCRGMLLAHLNLSTYPICILLRLMKAAIISFCNSYKENLLPFSYRLAIAPLSLLRVGRVYR